MSYNDGVPDWRFLSVADPLPTYHMRAVEILLEFDIIWPIILLTFQVLIFQISLPCDTFFMDLLLVCVGFLRLFSAAVR